MSKRTYSRDPISVRVGETLNVTMNFGPAEDGTAGRLGTGETISTLTSVTQTVGTGITVNSSSINTGGSYVDGDSLRAASTCILANITIGGSATVDGTPHVLTATIVTSGGNTEKGCFEIVVEA